MQLRVARRLQQQGGWVLSQVLVGQPSPPSRPFQNQCHTWAFLSCGPSLLATPGPLNFRGGVSLVRENSLNAGALDLAGSQVLRPVLPVTQTELLTLAPVKGPRAPPYFPYLL